MNLNKKLLGGSIILLITINLYNALNFGFQWSMARMLSITDYRELAVIISLIYILAIFTESVQLLLAKYVVDHPKPGLIKNMLNRSLKKSYKISSLTFFIYLILGLIIAPLLKLDYSLFALNGILIFFLFAIPITRGILQGTKRFKEFGASLVIEGVIKFSLAVLFVFIGLKVFGAVGAIILAVAGSLLISYQFLKDINKAKEEKADTLKLKENIGPVFFINVIIMLFISTDILIASMLFSEEIAGFYSLASIVGKIIFLATTPISKAMFPLTGEQANNKKKASSIVISAALLLLAIILICLPIFYFFPNLLIDIFSGKHAPESANILFKTAITFSLISFANLILFYKVSVNKVKTIIPFFITTLLIILFVTVLATYFSLTGIQISLDSFVNSFMILSTLLAIGSFFGLK